MPPERRRTPRIRCYLPVRLYPRGATTPIETLTQDFGPGGLRCLSPIPLPVSTPLSVEIDLGPGWEPVRLTAQTAWFTAVPYSEQFHLGLAFHDESGKIQQLLSRYLDRAFGQPSSQSPQSSR